MSWKPTLNLPQTEFAMKANLVKREPAIQERWAEMDLHALVRAARRDRPKFVLHDGPPYANGDVHVGTAMNKILKDMVVRYRSLKGFDAPYVPGWDCHGLPIEHRVLKEAGTEARSLSATAVRERCREYAEHWLDHQRRQFRRLGCQGDWDHPYRTMDPSYEDGVLSVFEDLVRGGWITRDKRSTTWCPSCATALAEAELEYKDKQSPSVYVRLRAADGALAEAFGLPAGADVAFLAWTTTPWTLPANLAVALHRRLDYVAVGHGDRWDVVARALVERVAADCGLEDTTVTDAVTGEALDGIAYRPPLEGSDVELPRPDGDRSYTVLLADYVSDTEGTGCVHTAPGHGADDFATGQAHGLPVLSPVDAHGRYTDEAGSLSGLSVPDEANPRVLQALRDAGTLLGEKPVRHSYPHCWRCKGAILYRATDQWFVRVDHDDLRAEALAEIGSSVRWVPAWGERRMAGMLGDRPDWCISRQRSWGIPIPALRCHQCLSTWTDVDLVARTRAVIRERGADAWFAGDESIFVNGERCRHCGGADIGLANDIFDVWFESGSSWRAVCETRAELHCPSDVVLEGTDQHRGWFQLSLLPAVAITGKAPWKAVVTHGFIVDEKGEKVSKSKGGLLNADQLADQFGADIARLWVASVEYREDVPVSKGLLLRMADPYRRLRNTFRWLLGNLDGFDPATDVVADADLLEEDRWVLARLEEVVDGVTHAFEDYEFARGLRLVREFADRDLSAFWFDFSKDRLYCEAPASPARRSGQTAALRLAERLAVLLAPILVHTMEEVGDALPGERSESIHLADWPEADDTRRDADLLARWAVLRDVRALITEACEPLRAAKTIRGNQEATITVVPASDDVAAVLGAFDARRLADLMMVSEVEVASPAAPAVEGAPATVTAAAATHPKCTRCWNLRPDVGSDPERADLCARCAAVVASLDLPADEA